MMKTLLLVSILLAVVCGECPSPLLGCDDACYLPSMYCCVDEVLTQLQFCPQTTKTDPIPPTQPLPTTSSPSDSCIYTTSQTWSGSKFYDQFDFFNSSDPTHGFVQFVDKASAVSQNLINVNNNGQVYMGVDSTNVSPYGRKAVRLTSKQSFTNGLIVLDLAHMPGSVCGTWPAFWTVGDNWPVGGEIDIIEGVNKESFNAMTLHTATGCSMGDRKQTGVTQQLNCDVSVNGNAGCGVKASRQNSYGDNFNANNGGVYAMERTNNSISIWYFARGAIPADLSAGSPSPCNWPVPDAYFPLGNNCPASMFKGHNIVFDITFCGDWAGAVFGQQCSGSCTDFVANNPSAFSQSYWLINSLKIFNQ